VAVAVARCGLHEPLDLGLRQVLAGAQVAIAASPGCNCSVYGSWRDQLEVSFRDAVGPPNLMYWSYNCLFTNSVKPDDGPNAQSSLPTVTKALRVRWNNGLVCGAGYVQVAGREGRKK